MGAPGKAGRIQIPVIRWIVGLIFPSFGRSLAGSRADVERIGLPWLRLSCQGGPQER